MKSESIVESLREALRELVDAYAGPNPKPLRILAAWKQARAALAVEHGAIGVQPAYAMCESGGGQYRVILGFETLQQAQDAHAAIVKCKHDAREQDVAAVEQGEPALAPTGNQK